jgi:hypothetical protein
LTHKQDDLRALGIAEMRLDFLTRAYDEAALTRVLDAALAGRRVEGTHTANFDRTLL